jgi:hypothetical protein
VSNIEVAATGAFLLASGNGLGSSPFLETRFQYFTKRGIEAFKDDDAIEVNGWFA